MTHQEPTSESSTAALSRRAFLHVAALGVGVSSALAVEPGGEGAGLIDTNVYLSHWPFRRTAWDNAAALVGKLTSAGVTEAWTGTFDALLHKDIPGANSRTVAECTRHGKGILKPVAAVNPTLPGWEGELRRCAGDLGMRILRLHPNYHGYTLADERAARVFALAAELGMLVQVALIMEDERTIHPLVNVPPVDPAPLPDVLKAHPNLRVQLLNAFRTLRGLPVKTLAARGLVFETAMLEGVEGVAWMLADIPADKLCFGSYAPFFYLESAMLKLRESQLSDAQALAVRSANARLLLP